MELHPSSTPSSYTSSWISALSRLLKVIPASALLFDRHAMFVTLSASKLRQSIPFSRLPGHVAGSPQIVVAGRVVVRRTVQNPTLRKRREGVGHPRSCELKKKRE